MKLGVVVVTHGQLAAELVNSAEMICGDLPQFAAVSIGWHDDVDLAREEIGRAIQRVRDKVSTPEAPGGVLVLTDMFGGTPSNISLSFLEKDKVEIVTGVNLPMIVKFAMVKQEAKDVGTLAHVISEKGSKAIRVASDLLTAEKRAGVGV